MFRVGSLSARRLSEKWRKYRSPRSSRSLFIGELLSFPQFRSTQEISTAHRASHSEKKHQHPEQFTNAFSNPVQFRLRPTKFFTFFQTFSLVRVMEFRHLEMRFFFSNVSSDLVIKRQFLLSKVFACLDEPRTFKYFPKRGTHDAGSFT